MMATHDNDTSTFFVAIVDFWNRLNILEVALSNTDPKSSSFL